jgi:DNA-binding beta-propeller fold protein YncE
MKVFAAIFLGSLAMVAPARGADVLVLEAKIPLGTVAGRIDHMAVDLAHRRLFVAELGNNTLSVIDLAAGTIVRRIDGLKEPQGVGYAAAADVLYVANADDGTVHRYRGPTYEAAGTLKLGRDADNVRLDRDGQRVFVGYGSGALAILEAATGRRIADVELPAHPESFQITADGTRAFVNLPGARQIGVLDLVSRRQVGNLTFGARGNFPMALDEAGRRLFAVYRSPATLVVFDISRGAAIASLPTCGDADDVFYDRRRRRVYVSCGEGAIAVAQQDGATYRSVARIRTSRGARTSLFVPEFDRLYVAGYAHGGEPAAIWVFRPAP